MSKFSGIIGFGETVETVPGVFVPTITERRRYYGDLIRNYMSIQNSNNLNDDINISNQVSVVTDSFLREHINTMKYVEFMNIKWKITNVDIQFPRLILSLGGVYNEHET